MTESNRESSSLGASLLPRILALLAVLVLVVLIVVRVRQQLQPPAPVSQRPLAVKVTALRPEPFAANRTYIGTLVAAQRVVISAELTGRVRRLPLREGQSVRRGDLLAEIDDTQEGKEIRRLEAGLTKLAADLRFWNAEYERDQLLFAGRSISQEKLDGTIRQRDGLLAAMEQSRQGLEQARTRRSYGRVLAPFDGVVQKVHTQPGELAVMGKPLLELVGDSALKATAQVPQIDLQELRQGQRVVVRSTVATTAAMQEGLPAVVDRLYPALDARSRTATLEAFLPPTPGLQPGMVVSLTVYRSEPEEVLLLSRQAVRATREGEGVFVVVDDHARWRPVVTGEAQGRKVSVLSGLAEGDQVILTPSPQLRDGQAVQVWVTRP